MALGAGAEARVAPPHSTAPASSPALQDDVPAPPAKEVVERAVKALKVGLSAKEPAQRIAALQLAAEVVHRDVVKAITEALGDDATEVRDFTIDLLGKIEDPSALAALHAYAKKNRRTLPDEPELYVLLLKSISRHGEPSSIELLTDKFFETDHHLVIRARILGLANIRDKRAVETLFELMTKTDRRKVTPHIGEFQLALNVLLGVDVGKNQDRWVAWWNDNKRSFKVLEAMPKLAAESLTAWEQHWGLERTYARNKKRGDRGKDPEGGK
ncbi:MAG: HEAT repeat domain-containing protein [Planctomycetota bacterium]